MNNDYGYGKHDVSLLFAVRQRLALVQVAGPEHNHCYSNNAWAVLNTIN